MATNESSVLKNISQSPSGSAWLELLTKTLGVESSQRAFENLGTLTLDDIRLDPIYPLKNLQTRDGTAPFRSESTWRTLARIDVPNLQAANKQLLEDLEQGADGAVIILKHAPSAFGFGVEGYGDNFFEQLLKNVFVDATHLRFEGLVPQHLDAWFAFCQNRNYISDSLSVSLGFNKFGGPSTGVTAASLYTADGVDWHNRGASAAQELGFTLSQLVECLRLFLDAGTSESDAVATLDAKLGCDADQFETLSKFRALRQLWKRVLEVSGIDHAPLTLHAETSWRMMSRRDPWINMLRSTVASFSAGLGGADSITILPHTQALGLPDAFARRVARNTNLVLQEESHLNHVVDPAAGAGLFDQFSAALAEEAWLIFQQLEAAGGWSGALAKNMPHVLTITSREKRLHRIKTRKTVSLGNSHFPKLDEKAVDVLIKRPLEENLSSIDLPHMRDGLPFEQLAERATTLGADSSAQIALVCIGDSKGYKPRESFAADFFAAAGMVCTSHVVPKGANSPSIDIQSTPIVCLCGSDADYAASASDILSQLQTDGAKYRLVAGRGNFTGADAPIFVGSNAHETLENVITILEGANQ